MNVKIMKLCSGCCCFLFGVFGIGGVLVVGWGVMLLCSCVGDLGVFFEYNGEIVLNGWIKIIFEGNVVFVMLCVEMGQGIYIVFLMLVVEELDILFLCVSIESLFVECIYGNVVVMGDSLLLLYFDSVDKIWVCVLYWIMVKSVCEIGFIIIGGSSSIVDGWQFVCEVVVMVCVVLVEVVVCEWNVLVV